MMNAETPDQDRETTSEELDGRLREAVERAHEHAGRAILFSSLVLVATFGSYCLSSEMKNIQGFGFLVSFTFLGALITDLVLLPALLIALPPKPRPRGDSAPTTG